MPNPRTRMLLLLALLTVVARYFYNEFSTPTTLRKKKRKPPVRNEKSLYRPLKKLEHGITFVASNPTIHHATVGALGSCDCYSNDAGTIVPEHVAIRIHF
jgi:hypothetical protein